MAALAHRRAVVVHDHVADPGKYRRGTRCCVIRIECIILDLVARLAAAQSLAVAVQSPRQRKNHARIHVTLKSPDLAAVTATQTEAEARLRTEIATEAPAMHPKNQKENLDHGELPKVSKA